MNGTFIQGSAATGVLVAALTNSEIYFYSLERENSSLCLDNTISNVAGGEYHVSVFVIKKNGLPIQGAATVPQNVMVVEGKVP